MSPRRDHERGTVALEFALFFVLLLALVAFVAPLGAALAAKASVGRAAGDSARFATQVPDRSRPGVSPGTRRPTADEVCSNAYGALLKGGTVIPPCGTTVSSGAGATTIVVTCEGCVPGRLPGALVTVRVERVVDLSLFGAILGGAGLGDGSITVIGTSQGRQE